MLWIWRSLLWDLLIAKLGFSFVISSEICSSCDAQLGQCILNLYTFVQEVIHNLARQGRVRHSILLILMINRLCCYSTISRREIALLSWHSAIEHFINISALCDAAFTIISINNFTFLYPAFESLHFVRILCDFWRRVFDSVVCLCAQRNDLLRGPMIWTFLLFPFFSWVHKLI